MLSSRQKRYRDRALGALGVVIVLISLRYGVFKTNLYIDYVGFAIANLVLIPFYFAIFFDFSLKSFVKESLKELFRFKNSTEIESVKNSASGILEPAPVDVFVHMPTDEYLPESSVNMHVHYPTNEEVRKKIQRHILSRLKEDENPLEEEREERDPEYRNDRN